MIIFFSGLGGSGKSTHIKELVQYFSKKEKQVFVVALREYFLWPKVARLFLKKERKPSLPHGRKKISSLSSIYFFGRDLFYVFDAVRITFFIVIPKLSKGIVIFDRAPEDFTLELEENSPHKYLHRIFIMMFPKPTLHFYLKSSPETVYARKKEDTISVLSNRNIQYEKTMSHTENVISISTEGNREDALDVITTFTDAAIATKKSERFSPEGYALYEYFFNENKAVLHMPALLLAPEKIFSIAISNRIALALLEATKNDPVLYQKYWQETWGTYFSYAETILEKRAKTVDYISTTLSETLHSFIKNDTEHIELGGDIDLLFFDTESYKKALLLFKSRGKIKEQTKEKADVYIDGLLPIDLHLGLSFGQYAYVRSKEFMSLSKEAQALLVTGAHAVAELTLVTLGDIVKSKNSLEQKTIQEVSRIAKKSGWGSGYREWITLALSPAKSGYLFPQKISFFTLVRSHIGLSIRAPFRISACIKELWMLLRAIRARLLGRTPFHEHWTKTIS